MFCLDLNCRSLVSEATTLPDVSQLSTAPVSDVGIQTHNSLHHESTVIITRPVANLINILQS